MGVKSPYLFIDLKRELGYNSTEIVLEWRGIDFLLRKGKVRYMDNIMLAVTLLITGFVVVFLVLMLLIGVIKFYGTTVYNVQNKRKAKKAQLEEQRRMEKEEQQKANIPAVNPSAESSEVPGEIVAVIAAAVDAFYGKNAVTIKSVKRSSQNRPVWSTAGLMDNTRPF